MVLPSEQNGREVERQGRADQIEPGRTGHLGRGQNRADESEYEQDDFQRDVLYGQAPFFGGSPLETKPPNKTFSFSGTTSPVAATFSRIEMHSTPHT